MGSNTRLRRRVNPIVKARRASSHQPLKRAIVYEQRGLRYIMTLLQIVAGSALLGGSFLVPSLVSMSPSDTFDDWRKVFLCYAFVLTLTNTIFVAFARFVIITISCYYYSLFVSFHHA